MDKIFVSGASGYIAKHIIKILIEQGYFVRGSVRNAQREAEVRDALSAHLNPSIDLAQRLECVELDLNHDAGWDEAVKGMDAVIHTASPFPEGVPKTEQELINPAVNGSLRAINAAHKAGIYRFIVLSSAVAIYIKDTAHDVEQFTEEDWTDLNHPACGTYAKSKTLAERAIWKFATDHPEMKVTSINPGLVIGAGLDDRVTTSNKIIARIASGADPMLVDLSFMNVDVQDVARMHVNALTKDATIGKRFAATDQLWTMSDIAKLIKSYDPKLNVKQFAMPHWMAKLMAPFIPRLQSVVPLMGIHIPISCQAARDILDIDFRPSQDALFETIEYLRATARIS